jgi:hypothetical protein
MKYKKMLLLLLLSKMCFAGDNIKILSDYTEHNVKKPIIQSNSGTYAWCQSWAYPYTENANEQFSFHGKVYYNITDSCLSQYYFIDTWVCLENECSHRRAMVEVAMNVNASSTYDVYGDHATKSPGKYEEDVIIEVTPQITTNGEPSCYYEDKNTITVK